MNESFLLRFAEPTSDMARRRHPVRSVSTKEFDVTLAATKTVTEVKQEGPDKDKMSPENVLPRS